MILFSSNSSFHTHTHIYIYTFFFREDQTLSCKLLCKDYMLHTNNHPPFEQIGHCTYTASFQSRSKSLLQIPRFIAFIESLVILRQPLETTSPRCVFHQLRTPQILEESKLNMNEDMIHIIWPLFISICFVYHLYDAGNHASTIANQCPIAC